MTGLLTLDVDGTLTDKNHHIDPSIIVYLHNLHLSGWTIAFVTGRSFVYAQKNLEGIPFPHLLAVQNGADILSMPDKTLIDQNYLRSTIFSKLDKYYQDIPEDYLVYSGVEGGDYCIYRRQNFSAVALDYLGKLKSLTPFGWLDVEDFKELKQQQFPLIKGFGTKEHMFALEKNLMPLSISTSVIVDPIDPKLHLCLITESNVNKGAVIQKLKEKLQLQGPVIAAGDDRNDIPMLKLADIAIAVEGAPEDLISEANIISSPGEGRGIIKAIEKAVAQC